MNYWILPWRATVFDLSKCLDKYGYAEWRQINKLSVGDIVFLYSTNPIGQIQYMLRVTKINIPYAETINKNFLLSTYNYYLKPTDFYARLEPITKASSNNYELSYKRLNQLGIRSRLQKGIRIDGEILSHILDNFDVVYDDLSQTYTEGTAHELSVTTYERDQKARSACLSKFGYSCMVCGFNFEKRYGPIGKEFIHVHHIEFISSLGGLSHKIDPTKDLIPVCPNCHAMLHRKFNGQYLSPSQLKKLLSQ